MGSSGEAAHEAVDYLNKKGHKVGLIKVRLYRPFSADHFIAAIPKSTKSIAVLDRTKEPGSAGEPLYGDVLTALSESMMAGKLTMADFPRVISGRYGLSSKEFTPAMVKGVFDELKKSEPKNHFTDGINDDLSHTSIDYDPHFSTEPDDVCALCSTVGQRRPVGAIKTRSRLSAKR
jgi:pyruvate-ferredoxin/flavodoxin oxidoreductase